MLCAGVAACSQEQLAERIVEPPNLHARERGVVPEGAIARGEGEARALAIRVGPPEAVLAVQVREPGQGPARGTILLLHGFLDDHHQLDAMARSLVKAGYRAVQVDLRGHGASTGEHITFGVVEARDLSQVLTDLQKRGLCHATVGVYGVSLGAVTGILLAATDPRVETMVAVAPYATLRESVPHFTKLLLPVPWAFLSDADFAAVMKRAEGIAGFEIDAASPLAAITRTRARVLLIHGDADAITLATSSERLHAAAPDHTELRILRGEGHLDLAFDAFGTLQPVARGWFDEHLTGGAKASVP
jgi:pimeloyl-ACP methyl ester carboxylesterase